MGHHRYLAVSAVSEIVCIEPNPYLQKRLRASARAVVEERRARRGPPLTVRVYAGTLCEYADEETLMEFDAVVCVLVLCSVTRLGAELAAARRHGYVHSDILCHRPWRNLDCRHRRRRPRCGFRGDSREW